jgi:two-component system CheB/CheR fusion protein
MKDDTTHEMITEETLPKDGSTSTAEPIAEQLEEELLCVKAQLHAVNEQHEVQAEELRAFNEDLQATNEELRSASEETDSSREELQSVNEELTTVNQELRIKVEELAQAHDDCRNLINSTDIATIFLDRALRVKLFTPRAREIFSLLSVDRAQLLFDISSNLVYDDLADTVRQVIETLQPVKREVQTRGEKSYAMHILPYRTTDDRINGAVLTFIDVTERKRAEEALLKSTESLRLVIENVRDHAIITSDLDRCLTSWNPGAQAMFGYTEEEILGQLVDVLFTPEDRAHGAPAQEAETAAAKGRAENERWHVRKDGTRFYGSGSATPLRGGAGELLGFVKIMRDLTASKRADEARKAAEAALQNADRRKDEFLATLAHELRNPLAPLRHALEILRASSADDNTVARMRNIMQQQVDQLVRLVDDLMDVSRITRNKIELRRERIELKEVVQSAVEAIRPLIESAGHELKILIPDQALRVSADPVRLTQVITNILNNAIKYTEGAGCIELSAFGDAYDAVVRVRDNGIGIEPELLPRVFDLFAQADTSSTRRQHGLGIGLTLTKRLVEMHGGTIEARSGGLGKGSEFIIRLPIIADDQPDQVMAEGAQPASSNTPESKRKILVVDDETACAEMLAELLGLHGYEVQAVNGGKAALNAFNAWRPDVVLLDIGMPDMDGYEVARQVRQQVGADEVVLIALTGWGQEKDRERVREAGFIHHLLKPIEMDALRALLAESQRPPASSKRTACSQSHARS